MWARAPSEASRRPSDVGDGASASVGIAFGGNAPASGVQGSDGSNGKSTASSTTSSTTSSTSSSSSSLPEHEEGEEPGFSAEGRGMLCTAILTYYVQYFSTKMSVDGTLAS